MFYVASFISDRRNRLHRAVLPTDTQTVCGWQAGPNRVFSLRHRYLTKISFTGNFFGTKLTTYNLTCEIRTAN